MTIDNDFIYQGIKDSFQIIVIVEDIVVVGVNVEAGEGWLYVCSSSLAPLSEILISHNYWQIFEHGLRVLQTGSTLGFLYM